MKGNNMEENRYSITLLDRETGEKVEIDTSCLFCFYHDGGDGIMAAKLVEGASREEVVSLFSAVANQGLELLAAVGAGEAYEEAQA